MIDTNDENLLDFADLKKRWAARSGLVYVRHGRLTREETLEKLASAERVKILFVHRRFDTAQELAPRLAGLSEDARANLYGLTAGWEDLTYTQRVAILSYLHAPGAGPSAEISGMLGLNLSPLPVVLRMALELGCYHLARLESGDSHLSAPDLARPIAMLDNEQGEGAGALAPILEWKHGWTKLAPTVEAIRKESGGHLEFSNSEFGTWLDLRERIKHEWFDRLAPVCEEWTAADIPVNLQTWGVDAARLKAWLLAAQRALSPARYLESTPFLFWPLEFRTASAELVDRWFLERTGLGARVTKLVETIDGLTARVRRLAPQKQGTAEAVRALAAPFRDLSEQMYGLPRSVAWPERTRHDSLPALLIIDDELGRVSIPRESFSPLAEPRLVEWRRMLCKRLLLHDDWDPENPSLVPRPVARATFIPGQAYSAAKGHFENSWASIRKHLRQVVTNYAMVLVDVRFASGPGDAEHAPFGLEKVQPMLRTEFPDLPVVMFTGEKGSSVVDQIRLEAGVDYLNKDSANEVLLVQKLWNSGQVPTSQWRGILRLPDDLIAEDRKMLAVLVDLWATARDKTAPPLLLAGSSGSGKSRLAKWIHECSLRETGPYEDVICGTLDREFASHELFGFYENSHNRAFQDTPGMFHNADGGTLFLDEIADLPQDVQARLKGVLDSPTSRRRIRAIGPDQTGQYQLDREVDVRVICATDKDPATHLDRALAMRLGDPVVIPALNDRPSDILALAKHFITNPRQLAKPLMRIDRRAKDWLANVFAKDAVALGNVRGLQRLIVGAAKGKTDADVLTEQDFARVLPELMRAPAETEVAGHYAPAKETPSDLVVALSTVMGLLDGQDWRELSEARIHEIERQLDGRFLDIASCLMGWYVHRAKDAADVYRKLTGKAPKGPYPQEVIKRVLAIDKQIGSNLREWGLVKPSSVMDKLIEAKANDKRRRSKPPQKQS